MIALSLCYRCEYGFGLVLHEDTCQDYESIRTMNTSASVCMIVFIASPVKGHSSISHCLVLIQTGQFHLMNWSHVNFSG